MDKSSLAVVLIITHKPKLSKLEFISIRQAFRILKKYEIIFVVPNDMKLDYYKEHFSEGTYEPIAPYWLSNYRRFNRLKVLPLLYKKFTAYDYILFYEPDAFVFRDDLEEWCNKGYSYIGAPWLQNKDQAKRDAPYIGVGNGGFSLRHVQDHLRVLNTFMSIYKWTDYRWYLRGGKKPWIQLFKFSFRLLVGNTTFYPFNNFRWNEDHFWGIFANRNFDWFTVPPVEEARDFSFEVHPARMFEENNNQLPFGCHAWPTYDLAFWKPHIEEFGYDLEQKA